MGTYLEKMLYNEGDILVEGDIDHILYMVVRRKDTQYGYTLLNLMTNENDIFLIDYIDKAFRKVA